MPHTRIILTLLTALGLAGPAYGQWIGRPESAWEKEFQASNRRATKADSPTSSNADKRKWRAQSTWPRSNLTEPGSLVIRFPPGWTRRGGS